MYDIIFLSYDEPQADHNWKLLKDRFPRASRIIGIAPIALAHKIAAKQCRTRYFWVIDADNIVNDDFDFSFQWPDDDTIRDRVAVWRAYNPINDLSYGYGGIKLLPRKEVLAVPINVIDFTTSISEHFHVMLEVASTTNIDTSPFEAWRSGFREAAKLSSRIISRQNDSESEKRLEIWTNKASGEYGRYAIMGAREGKSYGLNNGDLYKLNDWHWLRNKFHEQNPNAA
jgi:hypothetical protein